MNHLVVSTVGTSLLTNRINRNTENDWYLELRDTANLSPTADNAKVKAIIDELTDRAKTQLHSGDIQKIRSLSAELNGIYGYYKDDLRDAQGDMNWLIATDTMQGMATAEIVKDFLVQKGVIVDIFKPSQLSTESTQAFSEGVDEILTWISDVTPGYQHVCFNLVGGFKSLQAYLNTIGMFYADEIIYIFESKGSELIRIPRLPIKIDEAAEEVISTFLSDFLLMGCGAWLKSERVKNIPETLLFSDGSDEVTLSTWGRLIWNNCKSKFLGSQLVSLPFLTYENSFIKDFESTKVSDKRVKLNEVLGKVSVLLSKSNGDISPLKSDGGLLYEDYTNNKQGIAHFRVTQGIRVSCLKQDKTLILRRYGTEPVVNGNP